MLLLRSLSVFWRKAVLRQVLGLEERGVLSAVVAVLGVIIGTGLAMLFFASDLSGIVNAKQKGALDVHGGAVEGQGVINGCVGAIAEKEAVRRVLALYAGSTQRCGAFSSGPIKILRN